MREKRLHLCQQINSIFLEFGTLNENQFNQAIQIAIEVILSFFLQKNSMDFACKTYLYLKVSEDVLEPGEDRETIRAECNAMLKKGFHFQIEKIRDEDSIEKKFNYTFVCTNKFGFQSGAF